MKEVQPQNGFIFYNTTDKLQYGAFKSMQEGQINLMGPCPFPTDSRLSPTSSSDSATSIKVSIALKQMYKTNFSRNSDLSSSISIVPTLRVSPEEQIKDLTADALSTQWASSLLQDVYDFMASYQSQHATCPATIPLFRFVKSGLAITNVPGEAPDNRDVYLIEELIRPNDGPWRKYINNNSSCPRIFHDSENQHCSQFLAFCQHVQYWRTGCQAFTSDFQGEDISN